MVFLDEKYMKWFTREQTGVNKDVMVISTAAVNNMHHIAQVACMIIRPFFILLGGDWGGRNLNPRGARSSLKPKTLRLVFAAEVQNVEDSIYMYSG